MNESIYKKILTDTDLQAKLMLILGKSYSTIRKWAIDKDEKLTTIKAQTIIEEHLQGNYSKTRILINEKLEEWQFDLLDEKTDH